MAIIGWSVLERQLNGALGDAFGGKLPDEIKRTRVGVRLALARAFELIPEALVDPLGRLAKLRNDLAHGNIEEVDESRGHELLAAMIELAPDDAVSLRAMHAELEPGIRLVNLLVFVQEYLRISFEEAHEKRAQASEAIEQWWRTQRSSMAALSVEEIRRLLEKADDSDVPDAGSAD
jgi:hypothetical protein